MIILVRSPQNSIDNIKAPILLSRRRPLLGSPASAPSVRTQDSEFAALGLGFKVKVQSSLLDPLAVACRNLNRSQTAHPAAIASDAPALVAFFS